MRVNIIIFGQLAEITGNALVMNDIENTDELIGKLHQQYPALAAVKYKIAVNKKLVNEKVRLTEDCEIALLPPFSGG